LAVAQAAPAGGVLGEAGQALAEADTEVAAALEAARERATDRISLLCAHNHPTRPVAEAEAAGLRDGWASALAAGTGPPSPGEVLRGLARRRLGALFSAEAANAEPDSAGAAVVAGYAALARPGEVVLAPDPAYGAAQVHGGPLSWQARVYRFVHYGVHRESGRVDLDEVAALARQARPALLVAGGVAGPEIPDYAGFAAVAASVGARLLVDAVDAAGLIAAGLHPNPVALADAVAICTRRGLRGPRGGGLLCRAEHARAVDRAVAAALPGAPPAEVAAAKAVCLLQAGGPGFADYQRRVLAAAETLAAGLGAHGVRLVGGGTRTHVVVADLRGLGLSGRTAERAAEQAGLLAQRAPVPCDPLPPPRCSGLRLGCAAAVSRGLGRAEFGELAEVLGGLLLALQEDRAGAEEWGQAAAPRIAALARRFPVPGGTAQPYAAAQAEAQPYAAAKAQAQP